METLKVSTRSNPNSVAGAMAGVLRQDGAVEVQVVGAGALNQAIKAVAIARGYVAATGIDVVCIPTFADIEIDGERRTAIRLTIEDRARITNGVDGNGHRPEATRDGAVDGRPDGHAGPLTGGSSMPVSQLPGAAISPGQMAAAAVGTPLPRL